MTLRAGEPKTEGGVREQRNHLSRYVQPVRNGAEIYATMRGRRVARLSPVDRPDPLADLRARGLIREPLVPGRRSPRARIAATKPVSDLVADQRS